MICEYTLSKGTSMRMVPFTLAHVTDRYKDWFHDPIITKYNSHGLFPYTDKMMKELYNAIETEVIILWAIEVQCGGVSASSPKHWLHIGNVSLQSIDWVNHSAELAIILGDINYHGKGIGTWACRLAINHGINKLNLHRIWLGTAISNTGMQRIAQACNMKPEGTLFDAMFLDGRYVDVACYSIVKGRTQNETP